MSMSESASGEANSNSGSVGKRVSPSDINTGPWDKKDWLKEQYIIQGKSVPDIAKEYNVSESHIYTKLDEFDIPRRNRGHKGAKWKQEKRYTDKEFLVEEYIKKLKTGSEIAEMCGVTSDTIYHWMDKHGIKRREKKERVKELAPNWKGGYASDYGSNWKRMRDKTRERDGHTCQVCGHEWTEGEMKLDVHHITPIKKFDTPEKANTLDNLITLCRSCHKKWEGIPLRPQ